MSGEEKDSPPRARPAVILVVGMAGTGKTTLVHRMQHYAAAQDLRSYFINLDPAVTQVPYNVNIDIRDTVNYQEVMQGYGLGPNGAIMTSLNLFATKIHQIVQLLEQKSDLDWVVVDTPGQIEVFTWSASGQLITDALGAVFPTVVLFVADTTRCIQPQTFISTMLYSSGIMLKQQIPLLIAFNKIDVVAAETVIGWMRDPDLLDDAVASTSTSVAAVHAGGGIADLGFGAQATGGAYAGTLVRSMALFLHDFYEDIPYATVSAASGAGMDELRSAIAHAKAQALTAQAELRVALQAERAELAQSRRDEQLGRLAQDMH